MLTKSRVFKCCRAGLATFIGIGWAFAIFIIPLVVTLLLGSKGGEAIFKLEVFFIVTAVGVYSQSIIDQFGKFIKQQWIGTSSSVRRKHIIRLISELVVCGFGLAYIVLWLLSMGDLRFELEGVVHNLSAYHLSASYILIFLAVLGIMHAWDHPFFKTSTFTSITRPPNT
ncbi:MAG: hypothetical protein HQ483_10880 [Rhodospirillales bacterium]|nr:hypothetical protein [Rhodospirillales bacterium]